MNFFSSDSRLYGVLDVVWQIVRMTVIASVGALTVLGFCTAIQICRHIMDKTPMRDWFNPVSFKGVLRMMGMSLISLVVVVLGGANLFILQGNMVRIGYMFLYVCILYLVVNINLFSVQLFSKELRLSQIIGASLMGYPKFVFFITIISGVAFFSIPTQWLFITLCAYVGMVVYIAYKTISIHIIIPHEKILPSE